MKSEVIKLIDGKDNVTLTTYILEDSLEMLAGKGRPAVIVCPGGAYLSLSEREAEPVAIAFARMGYHAFVLKYSVYNDDTSAGWDLDAEMVEKPERQNPNPMRDIARAFVCINEHKDEWKVDMSKIAICGFSAGAHNCAMYSTHWSKPVITDAFNVDKEVLRPAACILGYPLTDYVYMNEVTMEACEDGPMVSGLFEVSNIAFLGKDWKNPDKLLDASPNRLIDADTPATFVWSTAGDNLVRVAHSTRYATALAEKKIPFEIHIFEEGDHGLATADMSSAGAKSQLNPDAAKWIPLCQAWLAKRFTPDIPEKTAWEMMNE